MRLLRSFIETPLGEMLALASDEALCALEFSGRGRPTRLQARLDREVENRCEVGARHAGKVARGFGDGK